MEYECKKKGCLHQSSSYSSIILATLREHCALAFIDTMDNLVQSDPKMFEISFKSEVLLLSAFQKDFLFYTTSSIEVFKVHTIKPQI
jgi:hypothetical protein